MGCSRGAATPDAHTQRRLFAASAGYCRNPNCANALFVDAAGKSIHIAEMAHVFSASDGGPHKRFVAVSCQKPALLLAAMRQEDNYMTNEHARQIAMTQSAQAVDEIWGRLSRNCPNYTATAR